CEGERPGTGPDLNDEIPRLQVAIPDQRGRILRTDDLGLSSDRPDHVPNRRRQYQERTTPHCPAPADRGAKGVGSHDANSRDLYRVAVESDEVLPARGLEQNEPIGVHRHYNSL